MATAKKTANRPSPNDGDGAVKNDQINNSGSGVQKGNMATVEASQQDTENIYTPLNIYDLEDKHTKGPIYVINNTDGPNRGYVTFQVPKSSGSGMDLVTIPGTWIPIDLMTKVGSRRQLLDSSDFKKCLDPMQGPGGRPLLILIHPKYASEILTQPGVAEEIEVIHQRENQAFMIERTQPEVVHNHGAQKEVRREAEQASSQPSARVVQLLDNLEKKTTNEMVTLNSLRSMGTLSIADYQLILSKSANYQHLSNFAKKFLKK